MNKDPSFMWLMTEEESQAEHSKAGHGIKPQQKFESSGESISWEAEEAYLRDKNNTAELKKSPKLSQKCMKNRQREWIRRQVIVKEGFQEWKF